MWHKFSIEDLVLAYELHINGYAWFYISSRLCCEEIFIKKAIRFAVTHGTKDILNGLTVYEGYFGVDYVKRKYVSSIDAIDSCGESAYMGEF